MENGGIAFVPGKPNCLRCDVGPVRVVDTHQVFPDNQICYIELWAPTKINGSRYCRLCTHNSWASRGGLLLDSRYYKSDHRCSSCFVDDCKICCSHHDSGLWMKWTVHNNIQGFKHFYCSPYTSLRLVSPHHTQHTSPADAPCVHGMRRVTE